MTPVEHNQRLGLAINTEIWNECRFEKIPEYFTEDFVADYSPRVVRTGRGQIEQMVRCAHATFDGFEERVHRVVADDEHIVLHFTITGRQVEDWGPVKATHRDVAYDEIVIMRVRDGKVCHQVGISDALLAMQQLGVVPDPAGFTRSS